MLLLIDNYDSFTYNLVHYIGELGAEVAVHRNDALECLPRPGASTSRCAAKALPCAMKNAIQTSKHHTSLTLMIIQGYGKSCSVPTSTWTHSGRPGLAREQNDTETSGSSTASSKTN